MSNLNDLVPPLELCKLIPAGEFEDSCFARPDIPGEPVHTRNGKVYEHLKRCGITYYPAPTLQEILEELGKYLAAPSVINNTQDLSLESLPIPGIAQGKHKFIPGNFWAIQGGRPLGYGLLSQIEKDAASPTTAALKLWLKLKGIEA